MTANASFSLYKVDVVSDDEIQIFIKQATKDYFTNEDYDDMKNCMQGFECVILTIVNDQLQYKKESNQSSDSFGYDEESKDENNESFEIEFPDKLVIEGRMNTNSDWLFTIIKNLGLSVCLCVFNLFANRTSEN